MASAARPGRLGGTAAPASQTSLRRHNLALVYQLVAAAPEPPSRAEVAARVGLTRATATALVDRLVEAGLVEELDARVSGRAGRPATPLRLARATMVGVGLEVNVDYLGARAIDLAGQVVAERIVPLNGQQPTPTDPADDDGGPVAGVAPQPDPGETLARLVEVLRLVRRAAARRGARIVGAALALPGPVDRPLGPLRFAPNLGWTDLDVAGILTGLTRTPLVRLDNEASLAARAELQARRGAAAPAGGFLYVSGGIGIGAGIVEPLGLYRGLHGWAGELGHVAVYPGGKLCPCGATGCLEQYAGRWAIAAAAGLPPRTSAARMAELAAEGRPPVVAALRQAGEALGVALAGAVNLVDIPTVVLGADLAILAPFVAPPIARQLRQRVLASRWSPVGQTVVPSAAPPLPALTGAALTVTDLVAADPLAYLP